MNKIKQIIMFCLLCVIGMAAEAETYSGDCGANGDKVKWELNTATGLLLITGNGDMADYTNNNGRPWTNYANYIMSVEIQEGINRIGNLAFRDCHGLTSIKIPNSVTSIGAQAFSGCSGLASIEIPNSLTSIEASTFSGCSALTSIEIPNSVTSIGNSAFYMCI